MFKSIDLKSNQDVKRIVLAAFPNYRKLKAYVNTFSASGQQINSYWDSGSRAEFAVVHIPTGQRKALPTSSHPYFDIEARGFAGTESPDVLVNDRGIATLKHLPADYALVEAGISMGKAATASVSVSADYVNRWLLPSNAEKLV